MRQAIARILLSLPLLASADHDSERIGCTAIAVDGAASTDGASFAGMNADSQNADFRLTFVPARTKAELPRMRQVFTFDLVYPRWIGYGRGKFFEPPTPDTPLSKPVGEIPEVEATYGYYESTEPLFNDQGLGYGESSCSANLMNRFPNDVKDIRDVPVGILDTVTLMQLGLERCKTARCAVQVMGELSEEFGFVPTPGEVAGPGSVRGRVAWDDAGEAYTLADATGEAWIFHVVGGVTGITKSVWAAQKVPKGHVAVIANSFILGELPDEPNDEWLFNRNIFRAAKAAGLWDGSGRLHFSKVFSPEPLVFEAKLGEVPIPLYSALRHYGFYQLVAPSQKIPIKAEDTWVYPTFVKPDRILSHRDVLELLRTQYEGTEFDMTQGILAGPHGTPFRLEGGPKNTGQIPRGISIQRTLYSIVAETGPKRQLAWYAMDNPTTSVYVPLYSRVGAVAATYANGHNAVFSRDSASWAFNFVSTFMDLNYRTMSQEDVYPAIQGWNAAIDAEREEQEAGSDETLTAWQVSIQEKVIASWWNMSDFLIMKYNDGRVNWPKVGKSPGYPLWYADLVGYDNDVHPIWVQPCKSSECPAASTRALLPNYVPPVYKLPQVWDHETSTWSYEKPASPRAASPGTAGSNHIFFVVGVFAGLLISAIAACILRRRSARAVQPSENGMSLQMHSSLNSNNA